MQDLDFKIIRQTFDEIIISTQNFIERDNSLAFWKTTYGQFLTLKNF